MRKVFSVEAIRAAEADLMSYENESDELMRLAAQGVAATARAMLGGAGRVLVVAGPGGNGGDGLYAAAFLNPAASSDALLVADTAHPGALEAFTAAGGSVVDKPVVGDYDLVIDAVAGLASARSLSEPARGIFAQARAGGVPILAVDVPTGIAADTGELAPAHVRADVTVTFGWARPAHAFAPECGEVVICDLQLPQGPESFSQCLERIAQPVAYYAHEPSVAARYRWPAQAVLEKGLAKVTAPKPVGCTGPIVNPLADIRDDKYSLGVVALCAGSSAYPGAGVLAAAGALGASPSMVRVVGSADVVHTHPEVVLHDDVASAGRAQTWVVGPGRGTDDAAAAELLEVLGLGLPTLCDADALTLAATRPEIRAALRAHPLTILTPHAGEFKRVCDALANAQESEAEVPDLHRIGDRVQWLARELSSFVLLKGRITVVCAPGGVPHCVNAGNSFAATPGSGDVLSGILGKTIARATAAQGIDTEQQVIVDELLHGAAIHSHAAAISAETLDGYGVTRASEIARAVPQAIARLGAMER